jgi:hypothetical protein
MISVIRFHLGLFGVKEATRAVFRCCPGVIHLDGSMFQFCRFCKKKKKKEERREEKMEGEYMPILCTQINGFVN